MTMTDDQGASIPTGPPLPTMEQIEEVRAACHKMADVLLANGAEVSPLVVMGAKVDALVALLGPDPTTPVRLAFDMDVARRVATALKQIQEQVAQQKAGPRLLIPGVEVPPDLLPNRG